MPIRIIESKQNARLKELRRALAEPGRKANGLAAVEGPNLLEEALRAGLRIRTVFAGERLQHWVEATRLPHETEVLVMPSGILASVLSTETPQPVAALVEPPDWTWAHLLGDRKDASAMIVVLAGLQDPGNLGTILRSAEAFGATGVVCLPGTVNAWNPKAARASAGSIFRVPLLYAGERDAMTMLREAGVRMLTTTAQGAQPVDLADLAQPVALMIGNEGNGVAPELAMKADRAVTIPCPGPVESLNAAVAASVMLYEAARQRAAKSGGPRARRGGTR